jgi:FG-GAP repeat
MKRPERRRLAVKKFSNSIAISYSVLALVSALVLTPLPVVYSRESLPPDQPVQEQVEAQEQSAEPQDAAPPEEDSAKQSKPKVSDPCKHREERGEKPKPKKQCLPEQTSGGVAKGDFNHDGFGDLAIGVPGEDLGTPGTDGFIIDAGAVNVIYGSTGGLKATNNQFWTEDSPGVLGTAEEGDKFGRSLASGDFNGDGFSDLAIGIPFEDGAAVDQGRVEVLYGSASGLTATGNQTWAQNTAGILDDAEEGDSFGLALVWGDFNHDGFGDLAIGVPFEDVGNIIAAGAVNVIYGSARGLTATNNQFWTQDTVLGGAFSEFFDFFGITLAAGDFNKDGSDDLAIGVPDENVGNISDAGEVDILYGSAGVGLTSTGSQSWTQDSAGIPDVAEPFDEFGSALAAGDFSGNGAADLAIGVRFERVGNIKDAGAVNVLYGTARSGLTATNSQFWSQNSAFVLDACEEGDEFGETLAAGDFNGDGQSDLAIGVPLEDVGDILNAGAVNVLYGSANRLTTTGNQFWTQDTAGVLDSAEVGDDFGSALTAWNFGNGPQADLAVGVPFEDLETNAGNIQDAGAVNVIYGSTNRLTTTGNQFWHQDVEGIFDQAEAFDNFGQALY